VRDSPMIGNVLIYTAIFVGSVLVAAIGKASTW
jgi:hypothetical protein